MSVKSVSVISLLATSFILGSSQFSPANAYSVNSINNAITIDTSDKGRTLDPIEWLVPVGTDDKLKEELSAKSIFKVVNLQKDFVELLITVINTTEASFNAAVVSLGLGIEQDIESVEIAPQGGVFTKAELFNKNFGGFNTIDICILASNNCQGGDVKGGLQKGDTDTFTLKINANNSSFSSGVTIASYPVKFQTDVGSYHAEGVPEPVTIIGSGLALGFGALLKKESAKKRSKDKFKA